MPQAQDVVVSNPPPHPTPNGDTLDDAMPFAGSVFDRQAHNLDTSPPTLHLLAQNLLSMSNILKRKQEEEDGARVLSLPQSHVPLAQGSLHCRLPDSTGVSWVEYTTGPYGRSKRSFKRIEKRLERIEALVQSPMGLSLHHRQYKALYSLSL
ncbi:hypothetical protein PGTUg99_005142 [Puccinia graminis f. sp. tritici]|uniref:Uncharacterized protein n=1 Tax=Puccinia graminis f. sp. tritici TaxID=56615 RepID=A0A5B0SA59_PUCGR|nr:hypothetical protein PGTUg99_005142 [Puccinia graminis f. sp. tritici]